ncbi:unnamed protein product [Cylicostephanus goldi]|uniref:Uncharacterized protein n=1 Tax=Cylicostephanus goldi TaxID=71465 RepID=A0A3P6SVD6_CYLGO|nr:unnamed protein product [Cylicostephanus goldi]
MSTLLHALLISALASLVGIAGLGYRRFILMRNAAIHVLAFLVCAYVYIRWVVSRLVPRIRGLNLKFLDLNHHLRFEPPEFIDRGFSDLTKYGKPLLL